MRIGVLLIGQTRQFDVTAQHMINEFKMDGVEVDYFCHTWDSIVNFSPWNNVASIDDRFSDVKKIDKKLITDKLNLCSPKATHIDSYDSLEDLFDSDYYPEQRLPSYDPSDESDYFNKAGWKEWSSNSKIKYNDWVYYFSVFGQFYSTARAMDLLVEYEREHNIGYDVIVRWRYDLRTDYDEEYRTENRYNRWIETPTQPQNSNTIYFNNIEIWRNMGCASDHYWFGSANAMKSYTRNFDIKYITRVRQNILDNKGVLNENIMFELIKQQKMSCENLPIGISIARPGATKEMSFFDMVSLEDAHRESIRKEDKQ
jgi:opacity protein-like surface antigen